MAEAPSTLLICTVGGSPEPVVAALKHWRPARVSFVHTPQTRETTERSVQEVTDEGFVLDPGRYDLLELPDAEDLASCIDKLRELRPEIERWVSRGNGFQVVVDLTGGTKCMSAAIATHASRWTCLISYVGGGQRTKEGVGTVMRGHEEVRSTVNPWDALGHQAVEDFMVLFDQHAFVAAARVVSVAKTRASRPDRKRELAVLEQLALAFDSWDRFDHDASKARFDMVSKSANDLRAVVGAGTGAWVLRDIERLAAHVDQICRATPPSRHHVIDLLANAKRRRDEGRIDDAVARLYRAIEALAQVALKERHGIESTEKVPLDRVPEAVRQDWKARARDGFVALGLQDAYALLASLNDPIGQRFKEGRLDGMTSPLTVRNRSVLAHGFDRVSASVFDTLWTSAFSLAEITDADLPSFPVLGASPKG